MRNGLRIIQVVCLIERPGNIQLNAAIIRQLYDVADRFYVQFFFLINSFDHS